MRINGLDPQNMLLKRVVYKPFINNRQTRTKYSIRALSIQDASSCILISLV